MKVAVYTISKNEEKFVKRWMDSMREADVVLVADTGSTDRTVELLRAEGAIVHQVSVQPWRFDIARNASMHLLPADIDVCVCTDLDEVLHAGWRAALEKAWTPETTRLRYQYTWSFNEDGSPGITYWYDKIHSRDGYRWVLPVHEVLAYTGEEVQSWSSEIKLEHHPDPTKSRSSYLPLLELAAREKPTCDRTMHYLGREYMYYGRHMEALMTLEKHLNMPTTTWAQERCASMRFISRCQVALNNLTLAEHWALRACAESPGDREPWVELAKVFQLMNDHAGMYYATSRALAIKERTSTYICEPFAWNHEVYDLASIGAWYIGLKDEAIELGAHAAGLNPGDARLAKNVTIMELLCERG